MTLRSWIFAGLLALASTAALAAPVKVTLQDGSVLIGDIVSLVNGVYTLQTPSGSVTISAASVTSINTLPGGSGASAGKTDIEPGKPLGLAGSTTIGDELAPALLEAYSKSVGAPDVTWTQEGSPSEQRLDGKGPNNAVFTAHLSRHGSATAFKGLLAGSADIGMASRRVNSEEVAALAAAGKGNMMQPGQENVLALDGIIVIVNSKNPVRTLPIAQMRAIYSGQITSWSAVGGPDEPIHLYGRDTNSGTYDTFNSLVMADAKFSTAITVAAGNEEVSEKVQGDPDGVGYVGFAYKGGNNALNVQTECGLTFPPSDVYVRTEEYPISRRLYLYVPKPPSHPGARAFIDFALGNEGQKLAADYHFIDLIPQVASLSLGRDAVAIDLVQMADDKATNKLDFDLFLSYAHLATGANRVTTTFRFQTNSSDLDSRAVRDIDRLAEFLKSRQPHEVAIAGFSDSEGSQTGNVKLSQDRADAVAKLLRELSVDPAIVKGFGRVAPVSCNSTPDGRQKNRRVEVWIE